MVTFTKNPKSVLAGLISSTYGINVGENDFRIRRVTSLGTNDFKYCVGAETTGTLTNATAGTTFIEAGVLSSDAPWWIAKRRIVLNQAGEVTININLSQIDVAAVLYIDGVEVTRYTEDGNGLTYTTELTQMGHEFAILVNSNTACKVAGSIQDGDTTYTVNENWLSHTPAIGSEFDSSRWTGFMDPTSAELDIAVYPSEVADDWFKITYGRINVDYVFGKVTVVPDAEDVVLQYPLSKISMLSDTMVTFDQVFDNWHRFSHNRKDVYPAASDQLQGWSYIQAYDCVESTINASTYVGFISDAVAKGDYVFNTIVSSEDGDDDAMMIILAATKQGDVDDKEHDLSLTLTRGGTLGSYIRLTKDVLASTQKTLHILDPDTSAKVNDGVGWKHKYGHVYAKKVGSVYTMYAMMDDIPTSSTETRDEIISGLVEGIAQITEEEIANDSRYFKHVYDATGTIFEGDRYYGYGQYSQNKARFWNIRRPNDTPEVTADLKRYFLDTYGFNTGDDGLAVENVGNNRFKLTFDNIVYTGDLYMKADTSK